MGKMTRKIDSASSQIVILSRKLKLLFTILFVGYCLFAVLYIALALFANDPAEPSSSVSPALEIANAATMLLSLVITGISIFVIRSIFNDMSCGNSPFSPLHERQIKAIGWLFVVDALVGAMFSLGFSSVFHVNGFDVGYVTSGVYDSSVVVVDFRSIATAVVCFALSFIWKYGLLLEHDEDNLM